MSTLPRYDPTDPRRPDACVRFSYKKPSLTNPSELAGFAAMGSAALSMVTRWWGWTWLAMLFSISSIISVKSLSDNARSASSSSSSSMSGWSVLLFTTTAFSSVYWPLLVGLQEKTGNAFALNKGSRLIPFPPAASP
ncbi:hypothetical protein MNV49_005790 [Pseudohyphozyma bogoriensis]|nr:hypothetical protein MNV49_005790 [Pseudohyphozyma bogoriensis]